MNAIDQVVLKQDNIREKYFHDLVLQNENIKSDLLSVLKLPIDLTKLNLIHEDRYINGIIADFTLIYDNKIHALIEVKAGDIGVTDYVRGIGQVLQYEYFYENNISLKNYEFHVDFSSIFLIPSSIFKNKNFNIALFKYPKSTKIIEINDKNKAVREISKDELAKLKEVEKNNLTSISQYYVRDTRLFEIYMLLRYLCFLKLKGVNVVNRKEIELQMRKTNSINNRNWRNVLISLSSFGFIDSNNMPTKAGAEFGMMSVYEFLVMMYQSYVKPYADILMEYFVDNPNRLNNSLLQIRQDFLDMYNGKEILFFTQSQTRYLSSWLNILRDDFGFIDFSSRNKNRIMNFNPLIFNDEFLLQKIQKHSKASQYINNLNAIL
ncbi:hypothetical protein [Moraxella cuniculi]|uniref:Uncharacterized protein n=1 Tax=Moraxella cuniculi TaxID=34061 RepID=A0A448GY98_9GAMM|nr:hypothetical protein [Moraxella cuniculi]VEG13671.1 Uncharacterised protein [Moraxella cuniculi]